MVNFERLEPLPHIVLQREAEQPTIRPRPFPGAPRVHPRPNRSVHAARIQNETSQAVSEVGSTRDRTGVVPGRLLVLRLETLDVNQRDTLERLNVSVVEELVERQGDRGIYRLLVQFPDDDTLADFTAESEAYVQNTQRRTALPRGRRRDFFDSLESISAVTAEERTGRRLQREGQRAQEPFYLDVDLWHPGSDEHYTELMNSFQTFVQSNGRAYSKGSTQTAQFDPCQS